MESVQRPADNRVHLNRREEVELHRKQQGDCDIRRSPSWRRSHREPTCALVTSGARNWESFKSSQISALVPSPLGNLAAASRTGKKNREAVGYKSEWVLRQPLRRAAKLLTQREDGDVWRPVGAQQRVLSGLVEGHLLVEDAFDRPHDGLEAVHPEGEGFVRLVVALLLLITDGQEERTSVMSSLHFRIQCVCVALLRSFD